MDALLIPTFLCPKAWQSMSGNDKERHCSYCNKRVHNLAAMTARERLALLSSPAAKVCSRYVAAIRRPTPGKEASYHRHLLKYGAGVAVAGAALVVLWERAGRAEQERYYQVAGVEPGRPMPRGWYIEKEHVLLGDIVCPPRTSTNEASGPKAETGTSEEITFTAESVERSFQPAEPINLEFTIEKK